MEYFKNKIFSGWFQLQLNDSIFKEVTNSRIKWKFLLPLASKETWNRKKNVNGIKNCSLSVLGGGAELRGCWCCPGTEGVVDLKESYFSYNPLHHSPHRVTDLPFPPTRTLPGKVLRTLKANNSIIHHVIPHFQR